MEASLITPIKLLHVVTSFNEGGVTAAINTIIEGGFYNQFESRLVGLVQGRGNGYEDLSNKIGSERVGTLVNEHKKWPSLKDVPTIAFNLHRELKSFNPDLTILSSTHSIVLGRIVADFHPDTKVVTFEHCAREWNPIVAKLMRLTSERSEMVLADAEETLRASQKYYRHKTPGFELPLMIAEPAEPRKAESPKKFNLLTLGRFVPQKNYIELIRAVSILAKEGRDFCLTIAGAGEWQEQMEKTAHDLGITSRIKFPGYIKDKKPLFDAAHIYVQPSLFEGQCIGVTEAMEAGLPIVASDVGGIHDYGVDGVNIIKIKGFKLGDKELKAEKIVGPIRYLMDNYRELAPKLSENAIEKSRELFGAPTVKAKWNSTTQALTNLAMAKDKKRPHTVRQWMSAHLHYHHT
jgi:glycosyltransferase involved in cell wall biosynthesis